MPSPKDFGIAIDEAVNKLQNYKKEIEELKFENKVLYKKYTDSNEMVNSACNELQFANLQKDNYKSILNEVEVLLKKEVKYELIKKVIENGKERGNIDIFIHNSLLFK